MGLQAEKEKTGSLNYCRIVQCSFLQTKISTEGWINRCKAELHSPTFHFHSLASLLRFPQTQHSHTPSDPAVPLLHARSSATILCNVIRGPAVFSRFLKPLDDRDLPWHVIRGLLQETSNKRLMMQCMHRSITLGLLGCTKWISQKTADKRDILLT